jgi:hypothetical protein
MSEEQIQFVANLGNFVSVKKLKIENKVTKEDIVEFLASIQFTCNQKITEYLEKIVDCNKLLEQTNDLLHLELNEFYNTINSAKIKKTIVSVIPKHIEKKQKDAYVEAMRVFLLNRYCEKNKLILGYNQVVFPSKKKIMKPKK